ncbi:MAG: hypothetical protein JJT95_00960 [Pararhodobacter sp.]|nr:hypothetical protein [Pararhodobacter sp.]
MDFEGLKKIRHERARDSVGELELEAEATALLADDPSTVAFLRRCVADDLWIDAVRVMAQALPRREAAWWACLNARESLGDDAPEQSTQIVEAAEAWVFKPSDELARNAFDLAEAAGFDSAESYAALAVFWASGNMAPPEAGVVIEPDKTLSGVAAAATIIYAVSKLKSPQEATAWYERAMMQALDIARGGSGRL